MKSLDALYEHGDDHTDQAETAQGEEDYVFGAADWHGFHHNFGTVVEVNTALKRQTLVPLKQY